MGHNQEESPFLLQQAGIWVAPILTSSLGTPETFALGPAGTAEGPTHHAARSYSAQTRTNSSKWWGPRMEESRVRYSKLSMMTATNRLSIWRARGRTGVRGHLKQSSGSRKIGFRAKKRIQKFVGLKFLAQAPLILLNATRFHYLYHTFIVWAFLLYTSMPLHICRVPHSHFYYLFHLFVTVAAEGTPAAITFLRARGSQGQMPTFPP